MDSIAGFPTDSLYDPEWIAWYVCAAAPQLYNGDDNIYLFYVMV